MKPDYDKIVDELALLLKFQLKFYVISMAIVGTIMVIVMLIKGLP